MRVVSVFILAGLLTLLTPAFPVGHACPMSGSSVCHCNHKAQDNPCCTETPDPHDEHAVTLRPMGSDNTEIIAVLPVVMDETTNPSRQVSRENVLPPRHGPPIFLKVSSLLI
ncbi:MAG TPA: hypothetical protein PK014_07910 [Thermoanaerobaculia bacterium]|nr:hypothetical protein [Thermoanaerobaculia bacterium]HUM30032.1 hypothetical protein [Thermoanaerobaculia bacterium]HXK68279.1 hypothetical protein [Thermoanaerobaculia bacterium]